MEQDLNLLSWKSEQKTVKWKKLNETYKHTENWRLSTDETRTIQCNRTEH